MMHTAKNATKKKDREQRWRLIPWSSIVFSKNSNQRLGVHRNQGSKVDEWASLITGDPYNHVLSVRFTSD
jgi:hypothetical protein